MSKAKLAVKPESDQGAQSLLGVVRAEPCKVVERKKSTALGALRRFSSFSSERFKTRVVSNSDFTDLEEKEQPSASTEPNIDTRVDTQQDQTISTVQESPRPAEIHWSYGTAGPH
jgi:hypothetical protein